LPGFGRPGYNFPPKTGSLVKRDFGFRKEEKMAGKHRKHFAAFRAPVALAISKRDRTSLG